MKAWFAGSSAKTVHPESTTSSTSLATLENGGAGEESRAPASTEKLLSTYDIWVIMLNNVFGVVVFLRWGFAVGNAGFGLTFLCIVIGTLVAAATSFSLAALITNGATREYAPGGVYYYISRTMGAEFGSMVGLIFYIAQSFAISFYLLGFGEVIHHTFPNISLGSIAFASISLAFCFIVCCFGTKIFSYFSSLIFYAIIVGILLAVLGLLFQTSRTPASCVGISPPGKFHGPHASIFRANWGPQYGVIADSSKDNHYDFLSIFGVVYPSMSGVLGGANLAGQCKDAATSIPKGTLYGIITMFLIYVIIALFNAISVDGSCLRHDFYIMQDVCWTLYVPLIGAISSTVSSGLSVLAGASRVFQAIGHDKIFPLIGRFTLTKDSRSQPYLAYVLTYGIAQALIVGNSNVNTVAPLLTNLTLLTFCLINFSCFLFSVLKVPNFRPRYRYYSTTQAGLGALLCFILMFLINWQVAIYSWVICIGLFLYLALFIKPVTAWGSFGQALYPLLNKYFMKYGGTEQNQVQTANAKYWRPVVLTLSDSPVQAVLLRFGTAIGKRGFNAIGHVLVGNVWLNLRKYQGHYAEFCQMVADAGFPNVATCISNSISLAVGASNLLMTNFGTVKPNTLLIGWSEGIALQGDESEQPSAAAPGRLLEGDDHPMLAAADADDGAGLRNRTPPTVTNETDGAVTPPIGPLALDEYMKVFAACFSLKKNIILLRNYKSVASTIPPANLDKTMFIDVVCFAFHVQQDLTKYEGLHAAMQYAYCFRAASAYKKLTMRLLAICDDESDVEGCRTRLQEITVMMRLAFQMIIIPTNTFKLNQAMEATAVVASAGSTTSSASSRHFPAGFDRRICLTYNEIIRANTANSVAVFLAVPKYVWWSEASYLDEIEKAVGSGNVSATIVQAFNALHILSESVPTCAIVIPSSGQKMLQMSLEG